MKLSEAIRLGSTLTHQSFHLIAEYDANYTPIKTCAFGAAFMAIGFDLKNYTSDLVEKTWPWLTKAITICPVCCECHSHAAIVHLNDDHHWTREQIADWVAIVEPKEQEQKQSQQVEVLYV